MTKREPDAAALAAFVKALFPHADEGTFVSLRAFYQFDDNKPPPYIVGVQIDGGGVSPIIEAAISGARYSANTSEPLVFAPPICTFRSANRASEADVSNGLAISVEIDSGNTGGAQQRLEGLLGPATVVVLSGGEWTDSETGDVFPKVHLHWRLSEPTRDEASHAELKHARRLACALVNADPTAKTSVHPLRWPGSWHLKGNPKLAQIAAINETAEVHLPEAVDALETAAEASRLHVAQEDEPHRSGAPQAAQWLVESALAALPNADEHWDYWVKIGLLTYAATGGSDEGLRAWRTWSQKSKNKFTAGACEERWAHFAKSPPTKGGAGTLFMLAKNNGWVRLTTPPTSDNEIGQSEDSAGDDGAEGDHADSTTRTSVPSPALFDPWASLQPVPFPLHAIPSVLREFVEDRAKIIGADPGALAWSAITACGAALDASIRLRMKDHDPWAVRPNLWLALVGAPSTKKTPILEATWAPLHRAQEVDLRDWRQEHARWEALPKKKRADTPEPGCRRRLVSHDATIEAIQDMLGRQDRGLGILRDELAGWVGSLEKYAGPKGGAVDRAFFLQSYNGGPYVVDRVARGTVAIDNLALTIAGGIQPDRLRQLGDLTSDGLWQRFLPIIVPPGSLGADAPAGRAVDNYSALIGRLLLVDPRLSVQLSAAASAIRQDVAQRLFEIEQSEALGSAFSAFCGKLIGVWGRLSLILSHVEPAITLSVVHEHIAEMARTLIFGSVLPNAAKVYASMGGAGGNIEVTRSIGGYILTKRRDRVLASDLAHNVRACRGQTLEDVQRFVSPLVAGGWLTPERDFNPNSWAVNRYVHVYFAARAAREVERRAVIRALITGAAPQYDTGLQ